MVNESGERKFKGISVGPTLANGNRLRVLDCLEPSDVEPEQLGPLNHGPVVAVIKREAVPLATVTRFPFRSISHIIQSPPGGVPNERA